MNRQAMLDRYDELIVFSRDPNEWLDSRLGGDLWIDGLNVILSVDRDDFIDAMEQFLQGYDVSDSSMMGTLQSLYRYCLDAAKRESTGCIERWPSGLRG